jgi:hypothetical protein
MEENREPLSAIAIEKKLQLLRNKHFSEDTIALVKSDYEYGLTEEETLLSVCYIRRYFRNCTIRQTLTVVADCQSM